MKRVCDFTIAAMALLISSPLLLGAICLIWWQDGFSPFYIAPRVGLQERLFNIIKLRSMVRNADKAGIDSTAMDDQRITPVGRFVRKYKLDELTQLWNVLKGEMSLVGPRPNVKRETDLYTREEKRLLSVRPGITDFASIVFSDEAEILAGRPDPDIAYNQLIRPGKSRLGIFYIDHASLGVDIRVIWLTAVAVVSKRSARRGVVAMLNRLGAPPDLIEIARRDKSLVPAPPPGSAKIVTSRQIAVEPE